MMRDGPTLSGAAERLCGSTSADTASRRPFLPREARRNFFAQCRRRAHGQYLMQGQGVPPEQGGGKKLGYGVGLPLCADAKFIY